MPATARLAPLMLAIPLLSGCGGSSHVAASTPAAVSTTAAPSTASSSTTATSKTTHTTSAPATVRTSHSSSTAASGSGSGSGGAGLGPGSGGGSSASGGGAVNARVPAIFTLRASGALSPSQVSAPTFLAVAVRINSAASTTHAVTIATPRAVHLQVRPHHSASAMIRGLHPGTYPILVDGVRRGALAIGGEPGP